MIIRRNRCLLCGINLEPFEDGSGRQHHPPFDGCEVEFTDAFGVAIELQEIQPPSQDGVINLNVFPLVDDVLHEVFDQYNLKRLGGVSSGRGWSSFSLYQRCPYAWKRRHLDNAPRGEIFVEIPALAIGTLIHAFLALYYTSMMVGSEYALLTPEIVYERVRARANPEFVAEAWRVFCAYTNYYHDEKIQPLAIEHDLRDPRTGESCRYDMIAFLPEERLGLIPGTYIVEHKSASRFDQDTLEGWSNDGEVLGQTALWRKLGLDKRFGDLQGVIVNILGKHKEPRFHRTIVSPTSMQLDQHERDLRHWEGLIQLSRSTGVFPRARAGCINRYGRCEHYDHCMAAESP
jgi:PD-(D/E)XK nuclease superfamily protein